MSREPKNAELLDLLAERAAAGLAGGDAARLGELLAGAAEQEDHFELAAAALEVAAMELAAGQPDAPAQETLPAAVAQRLRREARRQAAGLPPGANAASFRPRGGQGWQGAPASRPASRQEPGLWQAALPWLVAAVFCLAAITGWWKVLILSQRTGPEPRGPAAPPAPQVARAALLAGSQPLPFTTTADPLAQGVSGDVVWSPEHQAGFLRFQNLPSNDPKIQQYQLWIFDATRDDRFPIDGGVFDVPPGGDGDPDPAPAAGRQGHPLRHHPRKTGRRGGLEPRPAGPAGESDLSGVFYLGTIAGTAAARTLWLSAGRSFCHSSRSLASSGSIPATRLS